MEHELVTAIQNRAWWPVVGLAATLLIAVARKALPAVWERFTSQWKPLAALGLVTIAALADAFATGLPWQVAAVTVPLQVLTAWPTALGAADAVLRLSGAKEPSVASVRKDIGEIVRGVGPIALVLLLVGGCAPSLARSAAAPPRPTDGASPASELDRCQDLSRAESVLRYVAVGTAAASGAAGLSTIETDTPDADRALAITAAGLAVGAVVAEAVRAETAADFSRDCQ